MRFAIDFAHRERVRNTIGFAVDSLIKRGEGIKWGLL